MLLKTAFSFSDQAVQRSAEQEQLTPEAHTLVHSDFFTKQEWSTAAEKDKCKLNLSCFQKARGSTCCWQGCLHMQPTCSRVIFKEIGKGRFVTCWVRKGNLQVLVEGQLDFSTACQATHAVHRSSHADLFCTDMQRNCRKVGCKCEIVPML